MGNEFITSKTYNLITSKTSPPSREGAGGEASIMRSIILLGYMCSGKTTVGRPLAKALGCRFYDLDWYIEERFRKRIPQMFAEDGEDVFRRREANMLREVAEFEDIVLSLGGGTPCHSGNMEYMNQVGTTIYLQASIETLQEHIRLSRGVRPLLEGKSEEELKAFIEEQLKEREPYYLQAQHVLPIDVLNEEEKVNRLVEKIKLTVNS